MVQGVPDDKKESNEIELSQDTQPTPITESMNEQTQPITPVNGDVPATQTPTEHPAVSADSDKVKTAEINKKLASTGTLHLLSYLLWEREGVATFEVTRALLLDTITQLADHLRTSADAAEQIKHVVLGGQTILIEDIAAVRSDLLALLAIYNAGGRFGIGPWYVHVDSQLVSGESIIRNLLLGRTDVTRHGIELMSAAFMPHVVEHAAQLPQILSGFNITSLLITTPQSVMSMPFRWVAPDDSHVLVINHFEAGNVAETVKEQEYTQPDGPFLWLNQINSHSKLVAPDVSGEVKKTTIQSTLGDYVAALRKGLPDVLRPALRGELRLLGPGYQAGRLSSRIYLKQANARLQTLLTHQTEPLLALALTDGKLTSPDNLRALLDHSWRMLLQNQSRNNLTGCSHDTVTQETEIRNLRIEETTKRIQDKSLDALPGTLARTVSYEQAVSARKETFIGVWNSHSFEVEQIVELSLLLPEGMYPAVLKDDTGEEVNFSWEEDVSDSDFACMIGFRAKVASVGYRAYTLELADKLPESHHGITTNKGKVIGNVAGETLLVDKGQLVWSRADQRLEDFVSFHDGGDAGDTYNYRKPQPDVMVRAGMTDMVHVQSTATYERLIYRERMRIAPELKPDLSRTRGLSLLDITTTATFYDTLPGIYFRTTFTNKAEDHRLRAHLRTGIKATQFTTDSVFGLTERQIVKDSNLLVQKPQFNVFPMQTLSAVTGESETMVLLARGLSEVEPILDKGEVNFALTMLRAVGWINRGTKAARGIPAKGAQFLRDVSVDFAILPLKDADPSQLMRVGRAYTAPLQAYQYHEKPDPIQRSYLSFDSDKAIMTALKPPQTGKGWIVRFVNPTDEEVSGVLSTHGRLSSAKLVNLAEEDKAEYTINKSGINVKIAPHKIHTLRLEF